MVNGKTNEWRNEWIGYKIQIYQVYEVKQMLFKIAFSFLLPAWYSRIE